MHYTAQKIASITNGQLYGNPNASVVHIITDSRKVTLPYQGLFVAIRGLHHDGHQFIQKLILQQVNVFLVDKKFTIPTTENATFIQVENPLRALQVLARDYREKLDYPIIAITGSNGKTIVKEWLFQMLSFIGKRVSRSPRSYNSQLGVPLSLLLFHPKQDLGLVEAGISKYGEMEKLSHTIHPNICLITNIGLAHDEGFEDYIQKIQEKIKLAASADKVLVSDAYPELIEQLEIEYPTKEIVKWGAEQTSHYFVKKTHIQQLTVGDYIFNIPFSDDASVENLSHCIVLLFELGYTPIQIQEALSILSPVSMRLEVKDGKNRCKIIDDSYNNDFWGLSIAIDFLKQQNFSLPSTLILSDLLQAGEDEEELYRKVASLCEEKELNRLVLIGEQISKFHYLFTLPTEVYESTEDFLEKMPHFENEVVLVKGARNYRFERIVKKLQQQIHRTVFEINLNSITHNLNVFREKLRPKVKIMAMVKAYSYGSGDAEIAQLLEFNKVDYLAVAYADEGVKLRQKGIHLPIMVMNTSPEDISILLEYNLEPEIYSLKQLHGVLKQVGSQNIHFHIKLDTGMRRLGFELQDMEELIQTLKAHQNIQIASIFTHLAATDEPEKDAFTDSQIKKFVSGANMIKTALAQPNIILHALNSAGIARFPHYQFDMVRLGIGLYGVGVNKEQQELLKQPGTLKTVISQIKQVPQGETIGYGRHGVADTPKTIATVAIGYADGYSRDFSRGVGKMMVNGKKASVIGNVCMDMTMLDITGIDAKEGDEVIVFGPQNPVYTLAEDINTIPYELLTSVGERVKRVFFSEE